MSDYKNLKVGDAIRILRVPAGDLRQRKQEIVANAAAAGWTANTIEAIIEQSPVVRVCDISDGIPWYEAEIKNAAGEMETHTLAIEDDGSWVLVDS